MPSAGAGPSSKRLMMQEKFYSNHERRSSAAAGLQALAQASQHQTPSQPHDQLGRPAAGAEQPALPSLLAAPESGLAAQRAAPATHLWLPRLTPRLASPSTLSAAEPTTPLAPLLSASSPLYNEASESFYEASDCGTGSGGGAARPPLSAICNNGNSSEGNQLLLMDIPSDQLNFADINEVWLLKSWQEILVRVALVAPIVLLGVLGNLAIIYSMCRFKPIRSKPTNIFILNMALADLLTSIVCPNAALLTDIYQFYVLGSFVCRFEGFIKITCLLVSAYSLIALSLDWFLCVVKPCRKRITMRQTWLTLASIWIVSIAMALPLLFWRNLRERRWKDLVEVWCCEQIQYTKYYWVCMTLFLVYLPTCTMIIVLLVILAQMDKFEAKLRRSRQHQQHQKQQQQQGQSSAPSTTMTTVMDNSELAGHHQLSSARPASSCSGQLGQAQATGGQAQVSLKSSLSISIKYRRRIMKILFFYLLTSIVCWTPLQSLIVYRHFRTAAMPADWFFELAFYAQLCASLSAAMNPIIFGFLSEPFRRFVAKSWMFRLFDKVLMRRAAAAAAAAANGQARQQVQDNRFALDDHQNHHHHHHHHQRRHGTRAAANDGKAQHLQADNKFQTRTRNNHLLERAGSSQRPTGGLEPPRLTLDYVEHESRPPSSRDQIELEVVAGEAASKRVSKISGHPHRLLPTPPLQQQRLQQHGLHTKTQQANKSNCESFSPGKQGGHRSHKSRKSKAASSAANGLREASAERQTGTSKRVSFNKYDASVRILMPSNGSSSGGHENKAFVGQDELANGNLNQHQSEENGLAATNSITSACNGHA